MKKERKYLLHFHPLFFSCFIFCVIVVLFYFNFENENTNVTNQFLADDTVSDLLIDTPGCKIPAWDPWDASVKHLFKKMRPYRCPGKPSFLRTLGNSIVTLEDALIHFYYDIESQKVSCSFQEIHRDLSNLDEDVDSRIYMGKPKKLIFDKPTNAEFIKTTCEFTNRTHKFVEFLPLTPLKIDLEKRCVETQNKAKLRNPLNIIFVGLDSVSQLNYIRHFPKTRSYLNSFLSPISMHGYTKVGDNTFPNIVPLLTGHIYQYYYNESKNKTMFFDDVDFIWKIFSNLGYRTFLAEDAPRIATFNYNRNGFQHPPTNYYFRPFALAVERSEVKLNSHSHCFGSKMELQVVYDYLKSFVGTMGKNRPFFAFTFVARLTHDVFNYAGYADEPTYRLIKHLHENDILNSTMLVFFSDHGIRFGDVRKTRIGQYEERMPFMQIILPNWFLREHEDISKSLITNQKRLTTPFDIHATMEHLASLISGKKDLNLKTKPGLSLFSKIPDNRSCSEAGVTPHWCTCQVSKSISKEDAVVQKAAQAVISNINHQLLQFGKKCALLNLENILDARVTLTSSEYEKLNGRKGLPPDNYLVVLSVVPSKAVFEATVQCDMNNGGQCHVIDEVSRINQYGKQSDCVSNTIIKKFCFCI